MLTKLRPTLVAALATVALGAAPALAMPADPSGAGSAIDVRGEHAASLSDKPVATSPDNPGVDRRTPDAREPFVRPVVVDVGDPVASGFDWTAAIIGLAAGLALAVLAGVGVSGGRQRSAGPRTV